MTLFRYLENKPENWFVGALEAVELVTAKVPRLLVLEGQVAMIEAMKGRLELALRKERELLEEKAPQAALSSEIRENFALLARMYHDHFQTLQESGLEPKSAQKVKLDETRRVFHDTFTFLEPEQAIRLKKLEDLAERGELPILEFYKSAEGVFKLEQAAAERAALEGRGE